MGDLWAAVTVGGGLSVGVDLDSLELLGNPCSCERDSSREAEDSLLSLLRLRGGGQGLTMLPLEGQGVLLQLAQRNGGGAGRERSACWRGTETHRGG